MSAFDILCHLNAAGVNLSRRGDKLIASPKEAVTPEILGLLRAHKLELLAALPTPQPPPSKASEAELRRLVGLISSSQGFTQEDADEALKVALAHPQNALTYYRGEVASLENPEVYARRTRVLEMLQSNPTARYAVLTDLQSDPEAVVLTLAIRGKAICELPIPRKKYDGLLLLDLIERHCGTVH